MPTHVALQRPWLPRSLERAFALMACTVVALSIVTCGYSSSGVGTAHTGTASTGTALTIDGLVSAAIIRPGVGARLDTLLTRAVPYGFSGVVLAAIEGEIVLHGGYGYADRDHRIPHTRDAAFPISSLVKLFTSAAIRDLAREGRLRPTDSLPRFFPDVPADKRGITVQHLLDHTAGFHPYLGDDAESFDLIPRDSLLRAVLHRPLLWAPGIRRSYSNPGYGVLAAIVEVASSESYDTFLQRRLLQPAGMFHTGSTVRPADRALVGRSYRADRDMGSPLDHPMAKDGASWSVRGSGGMFSTAGDLYRWMRTEEARGEAEDGVMAGSDRLHYAAVARRGSAVAVLLSNSRNDPAGMSRNEPALVLAEQLTSVLAGRAVPLPPAGAPVPRQRLERLGGAYVSPDGAEVEVVTGEGYLLIRDPHRALERVLAGLVHPRATPDQQRREAQLAALFRKLDEGHVESVTRSLWQTSVAEEEAYWRATLPAWRRMYGRLSGARALGSRVRGDTIEVMVLLAFEQAERVVRVLMDQQDHVFIDTSTRSDLTGSFRLIPMADLEYITYNFATRRQMQVRFLLDETGAVSGLYAGDDSSATTFSRRR